MMVGMMEGIVSCVGWIDGWLCDFFFLVMRSLTVEDGDDEAEAEDEDEEEKEEIEEEEKPRNF